MPEKQIAKLLLESTSRCSARKAKQRVPNSPGLYAIFVDEADELPAPFAKILHDQRTELIYIGIAKKSLLTRLVEQDLHHRRSSTFFRSLGTVLDFRPPAVSLLGGNYKFSKPDTDAIIEWIDEHLSVRWFCMDPAPKKAETEAIKCLRPLLNITDNPAALPALRKLREECLALARQAPGEHSHKLAG
jgi:hypothetical protein